MWVNAQRDGRPAEYRWRPLFNEAVWLVPTTRVPRSNAAKTRKPLKFAGVRKLANRSQPLGGRVHHIMRSWGSYLCLTSFFPIVDVMPQLRRYSPTKLCDGAKMAIFSILYFHRATCSTFQTCILNLYQGHTMC